ncbi:MAG: acyltransferase [Sulfurimonas sp.]|nr:acyltransferase [Sulfurimonas sp.]
MFGYLRFLLAFLVLLSHIGVKFYTLNPGVIAVVIFYILAGYVVSRIYIDIFAHKKNKLFSFYKDRFLRIFPLYIYVVVITTIFLLSTSFSNPSFTVTNVINNLTIIPLNYFMYIDSTILSKPSWCLVPPAWSLATEIQAYILLPFALMYKRARITLALLSFVIFIVANFSIINPDYFGYRFLVGVFFIFLLGSAIHSYTKFDRYFILFIWISILVFIPIFTYTDSFSPTYTKETFIGILLGVPLVLILSKTKINLPFNSTLGSLSYALFLTHFLAMWLLQYIGISTTITLLYITQVTLLSLVLSVFGVQTVEKSITRIRILNK